MKLKLFYTECLKNLINGLTIIISLVFLLFVQFYVRDEYIMMPLQNAPLFALLKVVLVISIIAFIRSLFLKKSIRITAIDIVLMVFVSYKVLHHIYIQDICFGRALLEWIAFSVLYVSVRSLSKQHYKFLFVALLLSALTQAIYGQLQLYGVYPSHHGLFNITGSFFNPAPYAGYLCTIFPIALLTYFKKRNTEKSNTKLEKIVNQILKYLALATAVAIIIVLPATQSRAAWLSALSVGVPLALYYSTKGKVLFAWLKVKSKQRNLYLIGVLLFVMMALSGMYWLKKDSADGRLLIWQVSADMLLEKPLLGFGENGFEAHYMTYQADFFKENLSHSGVSLADNVQYAYNELLKISVEQGLLGLVLVILILVLAFCSKGKSLSLKGGQLGLLALLVFSMFSYPSEIIPIKVNLTLFLAIITSYSATLISIGKRASQVIVGLCLVTFLLILPSAYKRVDSYYEALCSWRDASDIYRVEAYEECLDDFELAYPILFNNGNFLVQYGKALSMAGKDEEAIKVLEETKPYLNNIILYTALGDSYARVANYARAEGCYYQAYNMVPSRFYPLYLLAKMYDDSGQDSEARKVAEQILSKEVKIPSSAIDEIREYALDLVEGK